MAVTRARGGTTGDGDVFDGEEGGGRGGGEDGDLREGC